MRLVIARCSVDYVGRLTAHLPEALRLLIVKADGSVLVHSDGGSYKPLNWMSPPCRLTEAPGQWTVTGKSGETLIITLTEVVSDTSVDLGVDPGLVKDGVEAHLQELLAVQLGLLGDGWRLVRREYPTPIGPVDLMCRDSAGVSVAVEIKRRGEIDGVEQLTRYLELLNRDPLLAPVQGVFAAQEIRPQARTLAADRGIRCVTLDYDAMRGIEREDTLSDRCSSLGVHHAGRRGDHEGQGGRDQERVPQAHAGGDRADHDRAAEQARVRHRRDPADVAPGLFGVQPRRGRDDLREDAGQAEPEQGEAGDGRGRGPDQQAARQAQSGDQAARPDQPHRAEPRGQAVARHPARRHRDREGAQRHGGGSRRRAQVDVQVDGAPVAGRALPYLPAQREQAEHPDHRAGCCGWTGPGRWGALRGA